MKIGAGHSPIHPPGGDPEVSQGGRKGKSTMKQQNKSIMDEQKIKTFADLIQNSKSTVFFGGAGVSTESGVKDYRSEDGLYGTVKQYGVSPEEILSHTFFEKHPDTFYDFYYTYFLKTQVKPNPAHLVLAELERRGLLDAVITQNIDGLHQAAGSRHVLELHGTVYRYHCSHCGREFPMQAVKELSGGIPICEKCGGVIRPDVVLYEEGLDDDTVSRAVRAIAGAELLIIGGTSLAVYPAAGFLRYFHGENVVLINRDETPYDSHAELIFRDRIGSVMSAVMERIPK